MFYTVLASLALLTSILKALGHSANQPKVMGHIPSLAQGSGARTTLTQLQQNSNKIFRETHHSEWR